MSNVLDHREKAIKDIERILVASDWQDSWGIFLEKDAVSEESEQLRDYSKPLFFKDTTPVIDDRFNVVIGAVTKIFYSLYSIVGMSTRTANNSANSSCVSIGFTIYSSDRYEGYDSGASSAAVDTIFSSFGTKLLDNLQKKQWGVSYQGDDTIVATEGDEKYWYRQSFIFTKIFY